MLVLTRKAGESVSIGPNISVVVLKVHGNRVKLGFTCPPSTTILRDELQPHSPPSHFVGASLASDSVYHAEFAS